VQLPAAGRRAGEQALEELNRGRHDQRGVPVLGRQAPALSLGIEFSQPIPAFVVLVDRAVVLDDATGQIPQCPAILACRLLDDARERNDDDDPGLAIPFGVPKREGQRAERLAPAGRHVERERPRRLIGRLAASREDGLAVVVQAALDRRHVIRLEGGDHAVDVTVDGLAKRGDRPIGTAQCRGPAVLRYDPVEHPLGVQPIRIHQGREHHTRQEIDPESPLALVRFCQTRRQRRKLRCRSKHPLWRLFAQHPLVEVSPVIEPGVDLRHALGQAGVMSRDRRGQQQMKRLQIFRPQPCPDETCRVDRASRGVIDPMLGPPLGHLVQHRLE
jgi:hypothetical protein